VRQDTEGMVWIVEALGAAGGAYCQRRPGANQCDG